MWLQLDWSSSLQDSDYDTTPIKYWRNVSLLVCFYCWIYWWVLVSILLLFFHFLLINLIDPKKIKKFVSTIDARCSGNMLHVESPWFYTLIGPFCCVAKGWGAQCFHLTYYHSACLLYINSLTSTFEVKNIYPYTSIPSLNYIW